VITAELVAIVVGAASTIAVIVYKAGRLEGVILTRISLLEDRVAHIERTVRPAHGGL
jgi:hypothetical protein